MTTLILVQKHNRILALPRDLMMLYEAIRRFLASRRSFMVIMGIALASVIGYLITLYLALDTRVDIERAIRERSVLEESVAQLELRLQKRLTLLREEEKDTIDSMVKVSSIKYLRRDNIAVYNSGSNP